MRRPRRRLFSRARLRPSDWWPRLGIGIGLALALYGSVASEGRSTLSLVALSSVVALAIGLETGKARERRRWSRPVRDLARGLSAFVEEPDEAWDFPESPGLAGLFAPLKQLRGRYLALRARLDDSPSGSDSGDMDLVGPPGGRMTRSGTFDPPALDEPTMATSEHAALEMISRLDPRTLRWLDSSPTEQAFLGWSLEELRRKSFLDVVRADDRKLAKQQLRTVLELGEGHGLIYRIETAKGETRAVEMNIGVRYGVDRRVLHLRCHLADVTAKLLDETELKRRTQELTRAVDDLRRANRKLEKLKDRYSDLYENAPAMYFTLDRRGRFLECNGTFLRALGFDRSEILGRPMSRLEGAGRESLAVARPIEDLLAGPIEFEAEWAKADGEVISAWVIGSPTFDADGKARQARCVAQDVTARRRLEAELRVKNDRLAQANAELSGKNRELDEFAHVVSHDLQEPLRTLIAFSEFLLRDQADRLDEAGKEHVRYLVDASKRLRALIRDLLELGRAGKVTAEFAEVDLDELLARTKADLRGLARSKGGEIAVEGPLPRAWGDRERLGQLLGNLVGNGLKYNKAPHPRVEVRARVDDLGTGLVLSIADNGIGIDSKAHSKIFQLFRRLHTPEEYEGTGAGLAISQKIVEAHGGKIWVESEPGRGSTFHVRLPTRP